MTTCCRDYWYDLSGILQMDFLTIGCLAFSRFESNQSEFPIHFITRGNLTTFEYFSNDQSLRGEGKLLFDYKKLMIIDILIGIEKRTTKMPSADPIMIPTSTSDQ